MAERDVTIILGVGPNLGSALARRFAKGGSDVAMLARDETRLAELGQSIEAEFGVRAKGYSADAIRPASFRAALSRVAADMGPATVYIHSISRWIPAKAPALDPEILADEMTLSVGAALIGSQAVLPAMQAMGRGTILWTGSRAGTHPETSAGAPALAASKAALRALALASAKSFHDRGINFGTITVDGAIKDGTPFAPDLIAEAFWQAHTAPREGWVAERVFAG